MKAHLGLGVMMGTMLVAGAVHAQQAEQSPAPSTIHVVLESSRARTTLGQLVGTANVAVVGRYGSSYGRVEQYKSICTAPCEADVDPGGDYKIGGEVTSSGVFNLPHGEKNPLRLNVKAGSAGMRFGGTLASVFGAGTFLVGAVVIPLAFAMPDVDVASGESSPSSGLLGAGIGMAVVGAVLLGVGIPLIIASGTHVETGNGVKLSHGPKLTLRGLTF